MRPDGAISYSTVASTKLPLEATAGGNFVFCYIISLESIYTTPYSIIKNKNMKAGYSTIKGHNCKLVNLTIHFPDHMFPQIEQNKLLNYILHK